MKLFFAFVLVAVVSTHHCFDFFRRRYDMEDEWIPEFSVLVKVYFKRGPVLIASKMCKGFRINDDTVITSSTCFELIGQSNEKKERTVPAFLASGKLWQTREIRVTFFQGVRPVRTDKLVESDYVSNYFMRPNYTDYGDAGQIMSLKLKQSVIPDQFKDFPVDFFPVDAVETNQALRSHKKLRLRGVPTATSHGNVVGWIGFQLAPRNRCRDVLLQSGLIWDRNYFNLLCAVQTSGPKVTDLVDVGSALMDFSESTGEGRFYGILSPLLFDRVNDLVPEYKLFIPSSSIPYVANRYRL